MSSQYANDHPGGNAMGDTLAFVKQLWGSMKIPGMSVPSLSPEDIDKQIADLKAVESWLQLNMNMLRSSIQALEVQSATLAALRSVGESFAKAASAAGSATHPDKSDDKPAFESPFQSSFQSPFQSPFQSAFQPKAEAQSQTTSEAAADGPTSPDPAAMAAPFANAAAWWNVMQEQFSNAVSQAMQSAAPAEQKTPNKPAKPAAKKTAAGKAGSAGSAGKRATKPAAKRASNAKPGIKSESKLKAAPKAGSKATAKSE